MFPTKINHKWLHSATVQGSGVFPVDMLRYDNCYPATTEDAVNILGDDLRTVTLNRTSEMKDSTFTARRWESFGWTIQTH